MLKNLLIEHNLIRLGVKAADWQEAIQVGAKLLENSGMVRRQYSDSIIAATKELGPYYVICPGVALPHSRPEDGVVSMGISIVTLKSPVEFGKKEHDPVDIVITLAATDKDSHIGMMTELVSVLSGVDNLERLRNAKSINEALALFD